MKHQDTPIVKANNQTLSYILLISLTLCFLCSLLFIGRPNTATCSLQQITFGVVFTVAVFSVLAKTMTVAVSFKVTAPRRRMRQWLVSEEPNFIFPICSFIQLSLCWIWLRTSSSSLTQLHTLNTVTSSSCATRTQSLPSTVSWDTCAPWPWAASLWLSWPGTFLTPLMKPSS